MGRRALPKIDRTVDVSAHHLLLEELHPPFEQEKVFGRRAPLELEIGSGKGMFLLNASAKYPERDYLGVEAARKYAYFAANRLAVQGRHNAKIVSGDGIRFLHEFVCDRSVDAIHVYFPDPWWKERHRRRRVVQPSVVSDIQRALKPGGEFHFWTDVEEYFETAIDLIKENSSLVGPFPVAEPSTGDELDFRTHFERRMRLNGHPVFRSRFERIGE
ncbi:MAG TPA: tRNA (guanosine(46)-N7)-methyltransferase TrmB [Pirellulaceae bacterium]|nr:tRNA (guanosine(46)-N7)-methyltransferase TrmB [Pirellulaceae bacterium]HMO91027.1 tRNA (guanosine(46)-N7)-methyltransferase TrmB [Pirellulaceae bacterium]HMP68142.1 tRNA (guanosine(46)-N7)-methyltransferase TrmB [Pirellulaceae bacterium]